MADPVATDDPVAATPMSLNPQASNRDTTTTKSPEQASTLSEKDILNPSFSPAAVAAASDFHTGPDDENSLAPHDLISRALEFLSNASNETLLGCLGGLALATYFVLGRVGLLIIGGAGGVVLHAAWEGNVSRAKDAEAKKRETALEVAQRLLEWRESRNGKSFDEEAVDDGVFSLHSELSQFEFSAPMRAALQEMTDAFLRDYVRYVRELGRHTNF
jgi:hypothetical protein